jgi:hypothetical protein
MKLIQRRKGLLAYTWSWYDENDEEVSPLFENQDQALDWLERYNAGPDVFRKLYVDKQAGLQS